MHNYLYLFQLDEEIMRTIAGFEKSSLQYTRTDTCDKYKREKFAEHIFGGAPIWRDILADEPEQNPHIWKTRGADDSRVAAYGFNELLYQLRYVLVEDAPWFMEAYPDHPMWELHPFCLPEYKTWAQQHVRISNDAMHMSADTLIAQLAQSGEQRNADLISLHQRNINNIGAEVRAQTAKVDDMSNKIDSQTERLTNIERKLDAIGGGVLVARQRAEGMFCCLAHHTLFLRSSSSLCT